MTTARCVSASINPTRSHQRSGNPPAHLDIATRRTPRLFLIAGSRVGKSRSLDIRFELDRVILAGRGVFSEDCYEKGTFAIWR